MGYGFEYVIPEVMEGAAVGAMGVATGVLLVCLGKATKQAEALQAQQKEYIAHIELGATTPCCDMEKEIDQRYPFEHITREMVDEAVKGFIG